MSFPVTNPAETGTPVTFEVIRDRMVDVFARRLGVGPAQIDVDQYFNDFGLDSVWALALATELEKWLGIEVDAAALWYYPTIAEFSQYLVEEYESGGQAA
ncbi:acyl carrier protein [Nocardia sp. GCM10030253]|uniref:acyl carrier protein n=1 Tax=Nocardia sp. GCM10030253 TaxID=3273404 RepID=UPI0036435054